MPSKNIKKKSTKTVSELDAKLKQADPIIRIAVSEFRKELTRLNKALAKEQVSHESEIEKLKALLAEEKKNKINVIINRDIAKTL